MSEQRRVKHSEWMAEGVRLFGCDITKWRFVCPVCRNVAAVEDFREFKDRGAMPYDATWKCIGRFRQPSRSAFGENPEGAPEQPCDYASFGISNVDPVIVFMEEGGRVFERPVFDFAREEQK